jgi:DNA-binding MarR family transcriptional regulator
MDPMPTDDRLLARQLLSILPLLMRHMASDMRRQGCALPPTHFALPAMLARRPRTMGELAERMGVSAPTMSNLIAAMAERGWVVRREDPADRRVALIELTAFGRRSLQRHQLRAEQCVARLLAALPPTKRQDLLSGLTALHEVVETSAPRNESDAPPAALPARPRLTRARHPSFARDPLSDKD